LLVLPVVVSVSVSGLPAAHTAEIISFNKFSPNISSSGARLLLACDLIVSNTTRNGWPELIHDLIDKLVKSVRFDSAASNAGNIWIIFSIESMFWKTGLAD
jgi:hypothetical protein